MKTYILFLSVFGCIILNGCTKKTDAPQPKTTQSVGISLNKDWLQFPSEAYFEEFMLHEGIETYPVVLPDKFVSAYDLANAKEEEQSNPAICRDLEKKDFLADDFAGVLSPNGLIEIEKWLFKVVYKSDSIYVAESGNKQAYDDLANGKTESKEILRFSLNNDVFALLKGEEGPGMRVESCRERGADGDKTFPEPSFSENCGGETYQSDSKQAYQPAAIYFSLMSEIKFQKQAAVWPFWRAQDADMDIAFTFRYKRKCRGESQGNQAFSGNPLGQPTYPTHDTKITRRHYEGTRSLSKYELATSFAILKCDGTRFVQSCPRIARGY